MNDKVPESASSEGELSFVHDAHRQGVRYRIRKVRSYSDTPVDRRNRRVEHQENGLCTYSRTEQPDREQVIHLILAFRQAEVEKEPKRCHGKARSAVLRWSDMFSRRYTVATLFAS